MFTLLRRIVEGFYRFRLFLFKKLKKKLIYFLLVLQLVLKLVIIPLIVYLENTDVRYTVM